MIKEHILDFSGIPEAEQSPKAREMLCGKVARWTRSFVLEILDVLGVERSKKSFDDADQPFDKDALMNRLVDWLYDPQEKAAAGKTKALSTPSTKKRAKAEEGETKASAKRKSVRTHSYFYRMRCGRVGMSEMS